jgi:hypothetical protein
MTRICWAKRPTNLTPRFSPPPRQPLTAQTGALRVVPGSHEEPLHSEIAALFGDSDSGFS